MSTKAYRDGWDRIFTPKPPRMLRTPFPLRPGVQITVEIPADFNLRDLRRFVWYLATMCNDWEPEMGFPSLTWPMDERALERTVAEIQARARGLLCGTETP
jgi:hypothetical protein